MMEENTNQQSETVQPQKSSGGKTIAIVFGILLIGLILIGLANRNKITQLSKSLTQTQEQVEDVSQESQEAQESIKNEIKEGVSEIAGSIKDINNPLVRLALAKAYTEKLKDVVDSQTKEDLNTVILYIEKQPAVLLQKTPQLPSEVQQALTNIKASIAKAKVSAVATSLSTALATTTDIGDTVTLTGTLEFVQDDTITGGSIFMLTDSETGEKYYLEFNATNSTSVKNMVGKEVSVKVKITGNENGIVTYDVVSGPTLATTSPMPTVTAQPKATATPAAL